MGLLSKVAGWFGRSQRVTDEARMLPQGEGPDDAKSGYGGIYTHAGRPFSIENIPSEILDRLAPSANVSTWYFACVDAIARSVAEIPLHTERRVGERDDEWQPVRERNPLTTLINRPNKLNTRNALIERAVWHLYLSGTSAIQKVRGVRGMPIELWNLLPSQVDPIEDPEEVIAGFFISTAGGRSLRVDTSEVIYTQFVNPDSEVYGLSPLRVLSSAIDSDNEARNWQRNSFKERAVPDGVISFKQPLTPAQHANYREAISQTLSGAGNARKIAVLGSDAVFQQMSLAPVEMDFLNSRKMTREEICAVLRVPLPIISVYENATLANVETARVIFYEETVLKVFGQILSELNRSLQEDFGEDLRLAGDLSAVPAMRVIMDSKIAQAQKLAVLGVPINEINRRLGLGFDVIPGGDIGLVPAGLVPLAMMGLDPHGADPDQDDFQPGDVDDEDNTEDEASKTFRRLGNHASPKRSPSERALERFAQSVKAFGGEG